MTKPELCKCSLCHVMSKKSVREAADDVVTAARLMLAPTQDKVGHEDQRLAYAIEAYHHAIHNPPNEKDEEEAHRVLLASYMHGIRERADAYVVDLKAHQYESAEQFDDRFREDIAGDQDVIYTRRARLVGYLSDYDWQSEWEDMGNDKAPTPEQIAYLCIMNDVREEILNRLEVSSIEEWFECAAET